ncbi:MAG: complex I NDUFA9 subunit family protein [Acidobacteriia bacterium]|nr:complex I NDUFA9 subunit family protein [Methyloceanibacter sp.]MCL6490515.1 complex I NDUFA9 subunit family protein [Terriglobia bacterium]
MPTRNVAAVFGGSGFIGRYVVKRLAQAHYIVRVAVRDPETARFLKPMGAVGQIVPLACPITEEAAVGRALAGADIAVNLVGILAERRAGDFMRIHAEGAGRVARLARATGVKKLVHISAIGADPASESGYAKSKAVGEEQVRAAFPEAAILRPSVVFGPEDQFFNRFAKAAMLSPIMPVIAGATRFQPVYVGDVADAVMAALHQQEAEGQIYELGGPRIYSFRELLAYVLAETQRRRLLIDVPMPLARLLARVMELLPGKPLTRDQLLLLQRDNVVHEGMPGLHELGLAPTPLELVVPEYLRAYRRGGALGSLVLA